MKPKKSTLLENIQITDLNEDGYGVGRFAKRVIFVKEAVPEDIVNILIYKKRAKFWLGEIVDYVQSSPHKTKPICEHFGTCGGCKFQHLTYQRQAEYKENYVRQTLKRLTHLDLPETNPIIKAPDQFYYRNKLEFTFTDKRWLSRAEIEENEFVDRRGLGFHLPKRFDKVLDLKTCFLQPDIANTLRLAIKEFAINHDILFFNLVDQRGVLRTLTIRINSRCEIMVVLQFYQEHIHLQKLLEFIWQTFNEHLKSLYYVINSKRNDTYLDLDLILYKGAAFLEEQIDSLTFQIGPKSFLQTNTAQMRTLYKVVRDLAEPSQNDKLLDLYTGIGTIALFLAPSVKSVIGIDYVAMAIENAKTNAHLNKIKNAEFYAGDVKDMLKELNIKPSERPNIVVTDPPRVGMDKTVIAEIRRLRPQKIVYVSCNPATQARDLGLLNCDYTVVAIQPIDMFPHTPHIENVILLRLKHNDSST